MTTILVVEDQTLIARSNAIRLGRLGYAVIFAASAEDAVRSVTAERPDAVLMDIALRGEEDGISATGRINALGDALGGTPVIYATAWTDAETCRRMNGTRNAGILPKPYRTEDIERMIAAALAARAAAASSGETK